MRDVLALQAEVARAIAREIRVKLTAVDQARVAEVYPVEPDAYEAYLRAVITGTGVTQKGSEKLSSTSSRRLPKIAPMPCLLRPGRLPIRTQLAVLCLARRWLPQGEGIGPASTRSESQPSRSHASLAWATLLYDHDFLVAERGFEGCIELNPRYAPAHHWLGLCLGVTGRLKRATRSSNGPFVWILTHHEPDAGFVLFLARRYDQAKEQFERVLELDPILPKRTGARRCGPP